MSNLREVVTGQLMRVEIVPPPAEENQQLPFMEAHHVNAATGEDEIAQGSLAPTSMQMGGGTAVAAVARNSNDPTTWGKVGRNEECPCGSGKKFKHCHGRFV